MAMLFNRKWTRKQLSERVGDPSQIARVRPCVLTEGKAKGVSAVDFNTGSGFRFTVLPDRGLDISAADYCGKSLCWRSPTGEVSPAFYQPEGIEWLYGFVGGLVCTCGLTYFGAPCEDEGQQLGLHGRVSNIPAQDVNIESGWEGNDYLIGVRGKVVESSVFGPNLCLTRSIFTFAGEERLFIHDEVTNVGHEPAPHMMLYHINFGFPVVDAASRFVAPSLTVTPRDAASEPGAEAYAECAPPRAGVGEQVYYHDLAEVGGKTTAGMVNPELNFGAYIAWSKEQLPVLVQWKMMGKGRYVMGVEPSTNYAGGRAAERKAGRLRILKPGESAVYDLEIGVLPGEEDIVGFEKGVRAILRRKKTRILKALS